jgi:two-component system nitrate/nitrite response regulator NarL
LELALAQDRISVRVVVVSRQIARRKGLAESLGKPGSIDPVGTAGSTRQALKLIRSREPDVVVLESDPQRLDGIELLRSAASDGLPIRLLVLSPALGQGSAYEALRLGARGLLSSDAPAGSIRRAILAVARGETVLGPDQQIAIGAEIRAQIPVSAPTLSGRERAVLSLAADGSTNEAIAKRLELSESTVKTYLSRTYRKLGVTSKASAVARAIREGLLELAIGCFLWQQLDFIAGASQALDIVA